MKLIYILPIFFLVFSGCSSLEFALHKNPYSKNLKLITLKKSEKVLVIEQTNGFIWGGLYPGVVSANPNIVKVKNVRDGRITHVYIQGLNIGETTLVYVPLRPRKNGLTYKVESEDCDKCFQVKVIK